MWGGIARVKGNGLFVGVDGLWITAVPAVNIAQVIVWGGIARVKGNGLFVGVDGLWITAVIAVNNAQAIMWGGIARVDFNGFFVGVDRLWITAVPAVNIAQAILTHTLKLYVTYLVGEVKSLFTTCNCLGKLCGGGIQRR